MFGISNFELFILSTLVFIITPGMDTVFVLNQSLSQGKRAGLFSTLGVNAGILVHTLFAAMGLSVIITQSAMAFTVIKLLGAIYLIYLGLVALFSKGKGLKLNPEISEQASDCKNFKTGLVTNVLNPKVALFFLSFFPQFVHKDVLGSATPFFLLGVSYALMGLIWYSFLVYFMTIFSNRIKNNPNFTTYLNKFSGIVFIFMGLKVALSKK